MRIPTVADLHLTELRKTRGNTEATDIARTVLAAVWSSGVVTSMLVVENTRGAGLKDSERTYRLMLLDLLALADAALPEDREDAPLQVIVARRQRRDGTLMSTREDLLADVVLRIEDSVEVGLAARGLLARLDAHDMHIWPAAQSAGLAVADFIANLTYNRRCRESRALFAALVKRDRLRLFEGLGGYAERRARIAERDGDLAAALARWALLDCGTQADCDGRRATALAHLWRRVLGCGTAGPMATLEAVLERLWRAHKAPQDHHLLAAALTRIESALLATNGPPAQLCRLHNLMHQVANQMGDLPTAERMLAGQSALSTATAMDPSLFHLMLDAQVLRTLTEELRLDFAAAQRHARNHLRLTKQYGTIWEQLDDAPRLSGFVQSRLWLRARMTLIRALLLAREPADLVEAGTRLDEIDAQTLNESDRSRLFGYRVWHAVHQGRSADALELAEALIERHNDPFALQHTARAAADAALLNSGAPTGGLMRLLRILRARADGLVGHPGELVWRDIGVLEWQAGGRQRAACDAFTRSLKISAALPDSPVNLWNRLVIEVHRAQRCGQTPPVRRLPAAVLRLDEQARRMVEDTDPVQGYRRISPY
ncbi:hypothetical protein [Candidatus Thiodictyon syntrophicum]|uniref:hypothetical protein n=1 Tax=Candidatus Thiodictyon syntrophicum TaxID=1166950 RepID=UPI0012FE2A59|nr:hypothetical protein [Candidatus Thiodictyon syntrophicum]